MAVKSYFENIFIKSLFLGNGYRHMNETYT